MSYLIRKSLGRASLPNASPLSKRGARSVLGEEARAPTAAENRGGRSCVGAPLTPLERAGWHCGLGQDLSGPQKGVPWSLGYHGAGGLTPEAGPACPSVCWRGQGRRSSETSGRVCCRESACCPATRILFVFPSPSSSPVWVQVPTAAL